MNKHLRLSPLDNVAIALEDLAAGGDAAIAAVPRGHKVALVDIEAGQFVRKYGQIIGTASHAIPAGGHVHVHNLGMGEHRGGAAAQQTRPVLPIAAEPASFLGYRRPDGQVGTRNYIGVLSTVNCAGSVAQFIAEAVEKSGILDDLDNVDGIVSIAHGTGCGMADSGEGFDILMRTLAGYARHPNFGAVLVVGLGCEVLQLPSLRTNARLGDAQTFEFLTIQSEGGTRATVEAAMPIVQRLAHIANSTSREPCPLSGLVVGLQCGGSDGLSGVTANPALGVASDMIVAHGGTTILSETPEIYGAEHLLTSRAAPEVASAIMQRIAWWEAYTAKHGGRMDNNPSPGNKRGGLTTILEKSLGAVSKAGSADLSGVYQYAEKIDRRGLVFMDSPGYDPCSVTGQVASGANLIVFTTGRGSVSGYKPVPSVKLSTNNDLWQRMKEDIDVNCGDILDGVTIAEKGRQIFDAILETASGRQTKSEAQGYGRVEFVPWQIGATM